VRIDPTQWETVEPAIRDARWATARCNDGTPFDFNLKFAPQRSKVWVVYLAGGGACDDPIAGWYFAGHTNVAALLAVIEERDGLDDSDSETEVLFAGSSAGAFGPMVRPRGSSSRSFWFW
jgi:hypothetical protein